MESRDSILRVLSFGVKKRRGKAPETGNSCEKIEQEVEVEERVPESANDENEEGDNGQGGGRMTKRGVCCSF